MVAHRVSRASVGNASHVHLAPCVLGETSTCGKARLGWAPTIGSSELAREMVAIDYVADGRD